MPMCSAAARTYTYMNRRATAAHLSDQVHVVDEREIVGCFAKMRRCNSVVAVLLPLCRIAMPTHRSQVQAAAAQLQGDPASDSDAEDDPGGDRRKRAHLRSQTKAKEEHERNKQTLKKAKVEHDADFLKSVAMMSPFVCHVPELPEQQRIKWAIEWTEHKNTQEAL